MSKTPEDILIQNIARNKKRYTVTANNQDYDFCEDTILRFLIFKDKIYSDSEFQEILAFEKTSRLFSQTIRFLSFQTRSKSETEEYLRKKKATVTEIEEIVGKLHALGYLSDEGFASEALDYCIRTKKGPKFLENKLQMKQVDPEIIRQVLLRYDSDTETETIKAVCLRQLEKTKDLPARKQKTDLYQKLIRDGFRPEAVASAIEQAAFSCGSVDRLRKEVRKLIDKYENSQENDIRNKLIRQLMNKGYDYSEITGILDKDE